MSALALLAAAAVGLMGVDGEAPAVADSTRVVRVLGMDPQDVRPIGLDAQLQPWWAMDVRLAPCSGMPGRDLDDAMGRADAQLADLEAASAVGTLREAIEALPCSTSWADSNALRVALESWGHAAQEAMEVRIARAAYQQLVAADPGWRIRPPPGSGFEELFDAVRSESAAQALIPFAVHSGAREVRWNGAVLAGPTTRVEIGAGRHLLQWSDDGIVVLGAWVIVTPTATAAALVTSHRPDAVALLGSGMSTEAGRAALGPWLGALRAAHGLSEIVVVVEAARPPSGYRIDEGGLSAWTADVAASVAMQPDRVRLLLGGGWLTTTGGGFQHVDIRFGLDAKIAGPLHLVIDIDVAASPISHSGNPAWDGGISWLPGFGAGIALRKPLGLVQPFLCVTGGFWSTPGFDVEGSLGGVPLDEEESRIGTGLGPLTPRIFADGGIDVIPVGGPAVLRVTAGAGWGLSFQARAGVLVGFRFGR
jgi:hypothetical protein